MRPARAGLAFVKRTSAQASACVAGLTGARSETVVSAGQSRNRHGVRHVCGKTVPLAWSACRNEHALKKKARPRIQADSGPWKRSGHFGQCPDGVSRRARLLTLRVAAVAAEVAARRVLKLAVAFGALTDERVVAVGLHAVGH